MKRQKGFSLIELLVSMAIVVGVVSTAIGALMQAEHATQLVGYEANMQEGLRAGLHFLVRDLTQAGEGIPQGGIELPYSVTSNIKRPGTATIFPNTYIKMPAITPGYQLGQFATSINPTNNAVLTGVRTDIINILYADNILQDAAGNYLYSYPIIQAAPSAPVCAGAIDPTGAFVTLAANCFTMPGATNPITTGNLIMFHNQNGTALEYVTSVAGPRINFAGGDPAGLNQTGDALGTVAALATTPGNFPPTTVTRVWLVTYYVSVTNPLDPQLIRQVNYPGYPAAAPVNPPQTIADDIENLGFSYDITSSTDLAGTYTNGPGNAQQPILPDTPDQIRAVNVFLAGRSEQIYKAENTPTFLRNNLTTQVSIRSLSFRNQFTTASQSTAP
ncbi:MAG: prepilin-type N-terminal cleavage/methylation domain-containing protein [Candidatus Acidiferrales bacterium]